MTSQVTDVGTRDAIDRFNDAVARKDVDALRHAITDECVFDSPAPPDGRRYVGEAMVDVFAQFFALDGEGPFEVEEIFVAEDRAVVRWVHPWEHSDGERGHVRGVDLFLVRNGKVAEKLSYVKG